MKLKISLLFGCSALVASLLVSLVAHFLVNQRIPLDFILVLKAGLAAAITSLLLWSILLRLSNGYIAGALITIFSYFTLFLLNRAYSDVRSKWIEFYSKLGNCDGRPWSCEHPVWVVRTFDDYLSGYATALQTAIGFLVLSGLFTIPVGILTGKFASKWVKDNQRNQSNVNFPQ